MYCIAGAWLCLNSMGHHVWKVIRSKSVFTRVTDGQRYNDNDNNNKNNDIIDNNRCCYYSLYVILGTGLVSGTATAAHFLVGRQEGYGEFKVIRAHNLDLRDSHEYTQNKVWGGCIFTKQWRFDLVETRLTDASKVSAMILLTPHI